MLEFEFYLYLQEESFDYVATIEWRMKIHVKQDKPHRKWTSIAQEFTLSFTIINPMYNRLQIGRIRMH